MVLGFRRFVVVDPHHLDADPDPGPDPNLQRKAQTLEKVLK
jgi:hypothetical protein